MNGSKSLAIDFAPGKELIPDIENGDDIAFSKFLLKRLLWKQEGHVYDRDFRSYSIFSDLNYENLI